MLLKHVLCIARARCHVSDPPLALLEVQVLELHLFVSIGFAYVRRCSELLGWRVGAYGLFGYSLGWLRLLRVGSWIKFGFAQIGMC